MTNGNGQTLAMRFQGRASGGGVFWKQVMAAAFVVSIPIAFMLLQRYMITGLASGAIKQPPAQARRDRILDPSTERTTTPAGAVK
jgi:hypothetical protein